MWGRVNAFPGYQKLRVREHSCRIVSQGSTGPGCNGQASSWRNRLSDHGWPRRQVSMPRGGTDGALVAAGIRGAEPVGAAAGHCATFGRRQARPGTSVAADSWPTERGPTLSRGPHKRDAASARWPVRVAKPSLSSAPSTGVLSAPVLRLAVPYVRKCHYVPWRPGQPKVENQNLEKQNLQFSVSLQMCVLSK